MNSYGRATPQLTSTKEHAGNTFEHSDLNYILSKKNQEYEQAIFLIYVSVTSISNNYFYI